MTPAAKAMISETDGMVRESKAAGDIIGTSMEAGIQEDGLMGDGEIRVGEVVDGQPMAKSESRTKPQPWIGKKNSGTAEG